MLLQRLLPPSLSVFTFLRSVLEMSGVPYLKIYQRSCLSDLLRLPGNVEEVLKAEEIIKNISKDYFKVSDFLYLGRGINYPIALEGALKLKEISYIHAEGYPAGEMKHGPIALIDEELPVVVLASMDKLHEKIASNIQEVKSRGGEDYINHQ